MRIVRRPEFLELPPGTMFHAGVPWHFGGLSIKGGSLTNDFAELTLGWVEAHDSGEAADRLEEMLTNGSSYPLETSFGRDGMFEADELYLVYERPDLQKLLEFVQEAMRASTGRPRSRWIPSTAD